MVAVARKIAVTVLMRVAKDGAFASASLDAEIRRLGADARDASLATQIVYGCLRVMPELDAWIGEATKKGRVKDEFVMAALRTSAFQLRHLERVPARAVVHDAVTLVRNKRGAKMGGFTNAVLRKLTTTAPEEKYLPEHLVVEPWVRAELVRALGEERGQAFLNARPLPPPIGLRVLAPNVRSTIQRNLEAAGATVRGGMLAGGCLLVTGIDPRKTEDFAAGRYMIQEQGAQLIAQRVCARPGERVLDACAGRGGKTLWLLEMVGKEGSVTAVDLYEEKLEQIAKRVKTLKPDATLSTEAVDLTVGDGDIKGGFDRVLVDAPCSGLGTVHRRPEILLRLSEPDLMRFQELQCKILSTAAGLVRPGGQVYFAVCSFSVAEGPGVRARFLADHPEFETISLSDREDGMMQIGPWMDEADGYQVAAFRRAD